MTQVSELRRLVCSRLRMYRKLAGLSQAEVAKQLGISTSAVGYYESGAWRPHVDALQQFAELYGVRMGDLFSPDIEASDAADRLVNELSTVAAQLKQVLWAGPQDDRKVALLAQAVQVAREIARLKRMFEEQAKEG